MTDPKDDVVRAARAACRRLRGELTKQREATAEWAEAESIQRARADRAESALRTLRDRVWEIGHNTCDVAITNELDEALDEADRALDGAP